MVYAENSGLQDFDMVTVYSSKLCIVATFG